MDSCDQIDPEKIAAVMRGLIAARYCKDDDVPCKIEEGLFLGSRAAAMNKIELKKLNITHILTVAGSISPAYPDDFKYKVIQVADREDTNLTRYFSECFDFIDEAKRIGGVLVHCFVGRSRSVTIVVAYLMKKHGMVFSQALEHVRRKRTQAAPNAGFVRQLIDFEKSLSVSMGQTAEDKEMVWEDVAAAASAKKEIEEDLGGQKNDRNLSARSAPYQREKMSIDKWSSKSKTFSSQSP